MTDTPNEFEDMPDGLFQATFSMDGGEVEVSEFNLDDDCDLSPSQISEIQATIKDLHDTTRYVIASKLFWSVYFDVDSDCWCEDIESATLFKRKQYADVILYALRGEGDDDTYVLEVDKADLPKNEREGAEE